MSKTMRQRWVVQLGEREGRQLWLGYDILGRLGNCNFDLACQYDSPQAAHWALLRARGTRRWPEARIHETMVDVGEPE